MQSGISFIVAWITIVLLCLVYTYFLFLSFSVIARCFVSFILVQFLYICVYVTVLLIKEKEKKERRKVLDDSVSKTNLQKDLA